MKGQAMTFTEGLTYGLIIAFMVLGLLYILEDTQ